MQSWPALYEGWFMGLQPIHPLHEELKFSWKAVKSYKQVPVFTYGPAINHPQFHFDLLRISSFLESEAIIPSSPPVSLQAVILWNEKQNISSPFLQLSLSSLDAVTLQS